MYPFSKLVTLGWRQGLHGWWWQTFGSPACRTSGSDDGPRTLPACHNCFATVCHSGSPQRGAVRWQYGVTSVVRTGRLKRRESRTFAPSRSSAGHWLELAASTARRRNGSMRTSLGGDKHHGCHRQSRGGEPCQAEGRFLLRDCIARTPGIASGQQSDSPQKPPRPSVPPSCEGGPRRGRRASLRDAVAGFPATRLPSPSRRMRMGLSGHLSSSACLRLR